jgi:hypothetical protein
MGTREVYEEKLRSGNLYHDPTINPGLGTPRCPRCLSLLNPNSVRPQILSNSFFFPFLITYNQIILCIVQGAGEWTITSVLHDATAVVSFFFLFNCAFLLTIIYINSILLLNCTSNLTVQLFLLFSFI